MQPNVTKQVKSALQQTASPALQQQIEPKELKEPKRLQQHKLLKLLKLLGTLSFQIKHTTVKQLHDSQNVLKGIKIVIFYSNKMHFRGPYHLIQSNSLFEFT